MQKQTEAVQAQTAAIQAQTAAMQKQIDVMQARSDERFDGLEKRLTMMQWIFGTLLGIFGASLLGMIYEMLTS